MRNKRKTQITFSIMVTLIIGVCGLSFLYAFPGLAFGEDSRQEIWLEPAFQEANKGIGNWAVADLSALRQTHVAFHVPENFDVDNQDEKKAVIVLIPAKSGTLDYSVKISVASNGEAQDSNELPPITGAIPVVADTLAEIVLDDELPFWWGLIT